MKAILPDAKAHLNTVLCTQGEFPGMGQTFAGENRSDLETQRVPDATAREGPLKGNPGGANDSLPVPESLHATSGMTLQEITVGELR